MARIVRQVRVLVGDEVESVVRDTSLLRFVRPVEDGHVVDWETERGIWKRAWESSELGGSEVEGETALVFTALPGAPLALRAASLEEAFGLGVSRVTRVSPALAAAACAQLEAPRAHAGVRAGHCVVVDVGYSGVRATCFVGGRTLGGWEAWGMVGGKVLDALFAEISAFRDVDLSDDLTLARKVRQLVQCVAPNSSAVKEWAEQEAVFCSKDTRAVEALVAQAACGGLRVRDASKDALWTGSVLAELCNTAAGNVWLAENLGPATLQAVRRIQNVAKLLGDDPNPLPYPCYSRSRQVLLPDHAILSDPILRAPGDPIWSVAGSAHSSSAPLPQHLLARLVSDEESANDTIPLQSPTKLEPGLTQIAVGTERWTVPEAIFNPAVAAQPGAGLTDVVRQAIARAPPDARPALWAGIVLVGGESTIPGLADRLQAELRAAAPPEIDVSLFIPHEPHLAAWRGAAKLALDPEALPWIERSHFLSEGASAIAALFP